MEFSGTSTESQRNMTERPLVRFDVAPIALASRNQAWKFQVMPGAVIKKPTGDGTAVRSAAREKLPAAPLG